MRVAVLLTGQPRHLEQGAWWFKNRVFPDGCGIDVDYYCYFWDNGNPDLAQEIERTYAPVRYHIGNYDNVINNFIGRVKSKNKEIDDWYKIPDKFRTSFLFDVNEEYISNYSKNIWGQYLCANKITNMLGNMSDYDIVIRTRSDVAFKDMDTRFWMDAFNNMYRNPIFNDKMFAPWLYVDSGIPLFSDFAFISKPDVWHNFNKNIEQHAIDLITKDKILWYELEVSNFSQPPHWIWNKLAMYSKTNMLSFSVTWPMPFDCKLFRYDEDMTNIKFEHIEQQFNKWDAENPTKS